MLSHIVSDLHEHYVTEILKPQLGKPGASTPPAESSSGDKEPGDQSVKRIRQATYDIRYRSRREGLSLEQAFNQYMSRTSMSSVEKTAVRDKLGIGPSASSSAVKEEVVDEEITRHKDKRYRVRVVDKNSKLTDYRYATRKQIDQLRKNPFTKVEMSAHDKAHDKGQPGVSSSKPKLDHDGDGKIESSSKEHAGVVHNAIQRATGGVPDGKDTRKKYKKSHGLKEGISNWREDLREIADEIDSKKQNEIKEMPRDKTNKITINPEFKEEYFHVVEETQLTEQYLTEVVDVASEFFYNCGLNENGIDIVIEEVGEDTFAEFVFELSEEYFLSEELKKSESKVKKSKAPTGTKQYATTIARVKKQSGTKMSTKSGIGSTIRKDKIKKSIEKAKETQAPSEQPRKKSIKDRVAGFILKGIERDKKARETAAKLVGQTGQTLRKATSVGSKAASEFAKGVRSGVETTASVAKKTKKAVVGEEYVQEKAESEQQQKLFGLALSVKRGETSRDEASDEVLKIVDSMSEKKIRDFAKTKHSEVPKKVEEAIARVRGGLPTETETKQRETTKIQTDNAKRRLGIGEDMQPTTPGETRALLKLTRTHQEVNRERAKSLLKNKNQKPQEPQNPQTQQNSSYEPEGDLVDEATATAKRGLREPHRSETLKASGAREADELMKTPQGKRELKRRSDYRRQKQTPEAQAAQRARDAESEKVKASNRRPLTTKQRAMSAAIRASGSLGT